MATTDNEVIDQLLAMPDDELLLLFWEEQTDDAPQLRPPSLGDMWAKFERWLVTKKDQLCGNQAIQKLAGGEESIVVGAVIDALGGQGSVTAAVLIVRYGVNKICVDRWKAT